MMRRSSSQIQEFGMVIICANGKRSRQKTKTKKGKQKRIVRPRSSTKTIKRRRTCTRPRADLV